ncbi:immunity 26/phosphotriesterase HocA family protein [Actinokineospora fastidiosa]|uniref:Immunity protein 26 of polymorphic toxin system n=1 Tax=Actinokineospora fastidiosa TaxID=1816 RepID=A0A918GIE0_9PSEU|nr:immunity 26/phosphotriesterase HocA family protein [Actinokineospora fastidiosa]GGS37988.1 hypothetical protein GCM10010171_36110 [Actinokineospora fastidiosa]
MNLRVLKKSRAAPKVGDVFVLSPLEGVYYYGRVVKLDAQWGAGSEHPAIMVYVYALRSTDKRMPSRAELSPPTLLIPPEIVNRLGWSRGYFETIGTLALHPEETLDVHCFLDPVTQRYVDEHFSPLDARTEPCGLAGLGNYNTVDEKVSAALGLPSDTRG